MAPSTEEPKRVLVRDDAGRPVVTRVYRDLAETLVVLLPDGQLGWPDGRAYTERPFRPATADELRESLREGPYREFHVRQSRHYLLFYHCSENFAAASSNLLESLYQGLYKKFVDLGLEVHEAEFPLVAVIYDTERAFRANNKVAPDVQAFHHILSNRIYFYETSERELSSPEVAAIRKPQTIAHEGTHQILLNIGVQPRLARWPIWLVEGLAEYCAPTYTRKGAEWAGVGKVNPLHMATILDLEDQDALQRFRGNPPGRIGPIARRPKVEELATKTDLTPVDYASAWALTHYLANKRPEDFLDYLKTMSRMLPLDNPSPEEQLAAFRKAFGRDLVKLDKSVAKYLAGLKYDSLPYFAVMFAQPMPNGVVRKATLVSQSPSMIRQWLDTMQSPHGLPYEWQAVAYPNKTPAMLRAEQWINNNN